jgi:small-conductance mechanosensitive channel
MMPRSVVFVAAVLLLWPALASTQSLPEAAAKERERRKGQAAPKVYTEEDLQRAGTRAVGGAEAVAAESGAEPGKPAAAGKAAGAKPPEKTEDELRQEQEKAWREKLQKATEEVQRLTAQADRLQRGVNDLTGNIYGAARTETLKQLEDTKAKLAAAQQQVVDVQEEGRRSRFR